MPSLHIISGSNGAGKSSVGPSYLPNIIQDSCTVFDGDKIFMLKKKELWEGGSRAIKENKKNAYKEVADLFDKLTQEALDGGIDFVYEGHFTNDATWDIPKKFKNAGYSINMIFFGLRDTDLSELRVVNRFNEGGHYVDPVHLASNFYGNLEKLNIYYPILDSLQIVDTSETEPHVLCLLENNQIVSSVSHEQLPDWFKNYLPHLTQLIINFVA
ncbi:MAG: zeta toxin family protein [Bacteroidota bacterium]